MTRAERLAVLGPDTVAKIRQRIATTRRPRPELLDGLSRTLAPALRRVTRQHNAGHEQLSSAA